MTENGPRPHLVLVALFFPPSRASGVYRPLAMANYFVNIGWDVTVVTVDREFFSDVTDSADERLETQVDPRVCVERVRMPREWMIQDPRKMSKLHAAFPRIYVGYAYARRKFGFPCRYEAWLRPALARVRAVHRARPADVVVATGNPWTAFRVAHKFGARSGVPYVADFRDGWTLDQFNETMAFGPGSRERRWEERLIGGASRTMFVNVPMRNWYAEQYPQHADTMQVLENGIDVDVLGEMPFRKPRAKDGLRLGYVGTITRHLPHSATWAAWAKVRDHPALKNASLHMYGHLGFFASDRADVMRLLPVDDERFIWEGPVSKTDVGRVYNKLDVILMMVPSSTFVTAGKAYESMAAGKAVVAIHDPETAASEPLRGYPLWFPVEVCDADHVADAIVAAAEAARTTTTVTHKRAVEHAAKYDRRALLEPFAAELREVIDGR